MKNFVAAPLFLVLFAACTDGTKECQDYYAETADPIFKDKSDCSSEIKAYREEKIRKNDVVIAKLKADRDAKPTPNPEASGLSEERKRDIRRDFGSTVCATLRPSNVRGTRYDLGIVYFSDHPPVYSLERPHPPGSADMQSFWSTPDGKRFCTDGGISGGDCIHEFPKFKKTDQVSETDTAENLAKKIGCSEN